MSSIEEQHETMVRDLASPPFKLASEFAACSSSELNLAHGIIGISTEAGELLDAFKKRLAYGTPFDRVNLIEELGDLEFYISLCRQALSVTRETVLSVNHDKLTTRYKDGKWTKEEAEQRDLAAERKVLEDGTNQG